MFTKTIILVGLATLAACNDFAVGTNTRGRKIYDETKEASPAIWRQSNNVTITTSDDEVISRIVVKDLRPEKDGDAKIIEGGEGQKNVTIELKSPTALRGYEFQIEVYAVTVSSETDEMVNSKDIDTMTTTESSLDSTTSISSEIPSLIGKDNMRAARDVMVDSKQNEAGLKVSIPINEFTTTDLPEDCLPESPVESMNDENMKTAKDAQDHEIVDFVLDSGEPKEALIANSDMFVLDTKDVNNCTEKVNISTTDMPVESSTMNSESTTNMEKNKYDDLETMNQDDSSMKDNDFLKVPFVLANADTMKGMENRNIKTQSPL